MPDLNYMPHCLSLPATKVVLASDGQPKELSLRLPCNGEIAVIDALNFVIHPDTVDPELHDYMLDPSRTEAQKRELATCTAYHIGNILRHLLGSDFADVHDTGVSRNRYHYTFRIGDTVAPLGLIGIHNFNTDKPSILVMIYGEGTHIANECWEQALYHWLSNKAIDARISRCDLAHDDFDGMYSSAELSDNADSQGGFALTNKLPQVQHLGDWKRHEGRGRTLQVGCRANGKLYRGYEKGKQLGDQDSVWFRHEIELGNKSRIIPLDILLHPSDYFAGSYPYMEQIAQFAHGHNNFSPTPIATVRKQLAISFQKSIEIIRRQFGKYLKVYRDLFTDDSEILDLVVTQKEDYYPKRLRLFQKMIFRPPSYVPWHKIGYKHIQLTLREIAHAV